VKKIEKGAGRGYARCKKATDRSGQDEAIPAEERNTSRKDNSTRHAKRKLVRGAGAEVRGMGEEEGRPMERARRALSTNLAAQCRRIRTKSCGGRPVATMAPNLGETRIVERAELSFRDLRCCWPPAPARWLAWPSPRWAPRGSPAASRSGYRASSHARQIGQPGALLPNRHPPHDRRY
jgi:hypothetical protein